MYFINADTSTSHSIKKFGYAVWHLVLLEIAINPSKETSETLNITNLISYKNKKETDVAEGADGVH